MNAIKEAIDAMDVNLGKQLDNISQHEAKKAAQPFVTNDLLEELSERIKTLDKNIQKQSEYTTKLTRAMYFLLIAALAVAVVGIFVAKGLF